VYVQHRGNVNVCTCQCVAPPLTGRDINRTSRVFSQSENGSDANGGGKRAIEVVHVSIAHAADAPTTRAESPYDCFTLLKCEYCH